MKKIRYIPYGYTMQNGQIIVDEDEADGPHAQCAAQDAGVPVGQAGDGPSDGTEQAEEEHDVPDKVQAVHDEHERAGLVRVMEATP